MNCDGQVDASDINPFVLALASPTLYRQRYPHCFLENADTNGDGYVTFGDINPFIPILGSDCNRTWLGADSTCGQCSPQQVIVPDDLPFLNRSTTCRRGNKHDATCLGSYDSGEDVVYELVVVSGPIDVEIMLDPKGTTYTGLLLDDSFPPDGDCLALSTNLDGSVHGLGCVRLNAGTYYVMIDSWAPRECIEQFELAIELCTPPLGRCCYGDPPQCADLPQYECTALAGTWDLELTCATPCPDPAGEDCRHATPIASVPYSAQLDNREMTADGPAAPCDKYAPSGPMARDAWFVWTAPADGLATVRVSGESDPEHDLVLVVRDGCAQQLALYCADNDEGPLRNQELIRFPVTMGKTYYFQVGDAGNFGRSTAETLFELELATGSGACCLPNGSCQELDSVECWQQAGNYQGDGTTCAATNCPPHTPGDNCDDPIEVTLNSSSLPYVDLNWTTGRGNDYDNTCLGSFDSGDDIVYRLTVTEAVSVRITLDPKGTPYTGFLLTDACPPTGNCLVTQRSTKGTPYPSFHYYPCVLVPGVYYLVVDKWLSPASIRQFELRIESTPAPTGACCVDGQCVGTMWREECHALGGNWFWKKDCGTFTCPAAGGETCANPFVIHIRPPQQLEYTFNHTTCGRGDAYSGNTCMTPYDGGEDMIYKVIVSGDPIRVDIIADTDVGLAVGDTCPPTGSCTFGTGWILGVLLDPGEHYLMVDTRPDYWYGGSWPGHCQSYSLRIQRAR